MSRRKRIKEIDKTRKTGGKIMGLTLVCVCVCARATCYGEIQWSACPREDVYIRGEEFHYIDTASWNKNKRKEKGFFFLLYD